MTAYRVTARRSGDWWAIEVPDLPGVFSQAKRLDKADEAAREAIAVMLDIETDDVEVDIQPVLPKDAAHALKAAEAAEEVAEQARQAAQRAMKDAAVALTKSMSQRDAGRILGVSFQRVSQLLQARLAPAPKKAGRAALSSRACAEERPARQKRRQRDKELAR